MAVTRRDLRDTGMTRVHLGHPRQKHRDVTQRDPAHGREADLAARGVFAVLSPDEMSVSEARRAAPAAAKPAPRRWSPRAVFHRLLAVYARFRRPG